MEAVPQLIFWCLVSVTLETEADRWDVLLLELAGLTHTVCRPQFSCCFPDRGGKYLLCELSNPVTESVHVIIPTSNEWAHWRETKEHFSPPPQVPSPSLFLSCAAFYFFFFFIFIYFKYKKRDQGRFNGHGFSVSGLLLWGWLTLLSNTSAQTCNTHLPSPFVEFFSFTLCGNAAKTTKPSKPHSWFQCAYTVREKNSW